jgi:hypothetical protein
MIRDDPLELNVELHDKCFPFFDEDWIEVPHPVHVSW